MTSGRQILKKFKGRNFKSRDYKLLKSYEDYKIIDCEIDSVYMDDHNNLIVLEKDWKGLLRECFPIMLMED